MIARSDPLPGGTFPVGTTWRVNSSHVSVVLRTWLLHLPGKYVGIIYSKWSWTRFKFLRMLAALKKKTWSSLKISSVLTSESSNNCNSKSGKRDNRKILFHLPHGIPGISIRKSSYLFLFFYLILFFIYLF